MKLSPALLLLTISLAKEPHNWLTYSGSNRKERP